ncbi:HIT domain-containing protein [Candidatus Woesearchaeota archaeon]|nr:HIT domain-containing protein [Candidatus Woesearchaeota archaeon]MBT5271850.1 HIT domain-containing protein [Candidatus Woesearchaeota archaeon]MBT6337338.1 HIT domain-containing protein [Candidatus Woesearchaeota archaeon]MBT7927586.1 HIT domain-containing protein [Candidatus Woesearchaeota archaeon]
MELSPEQQKALEAQKEQCPFCKIIKGDIPSQKVYEDDLITAVLDINPANKGHLLVMPKEHYPIMPLIPPKTFEHLAIKTKQLSKSVKEGALVFGTNIFIANGAAAGQQSQHFMLHIIPREENDGISAFDYEKIDVDKAKEDEAFKILGHNLPKMLRDVCKRFPMEGIQQPKVGYSKEELLKIIEMNPQLKEAIIKSPEQFKQMIPSNPQLKQLFENIDVNEIIETVSGKKMTNAIDAEFNAPEVTETPEGNGKFDAIQQVLQGGAQEGITGEETTNKDEEPETIIDTIEHNPKLKTLLINDPETLKQKIQDVPQLQELFGDQDIDALRNEILEREQNRSEESSDDDEDQNDENQEKSSDDEDYDAEEDSSNQNKTTKIPEENGTRSDDIADIL